MEQRGQRFGGAGRLLLLAAALQFGCGDAPKRPAPPERALRPVLSLKQLMEWVIDPAADAVWDPVKTIITEQGTKEIAPQTQEEWDAVRNGGAPAGRYRGTGAQGRRSERCPGGICRRRRDLQCLLGMSSALCAPIECGFRRSIDSVPGSSRRRSARRSRALHGSFRPCRRSISWRSRR